MAVIGDNRKLLVFPLAEVNEMTRGKGVRLQKYAQGGIADARVFAAADGLTWLDTRRPHVHAGDGGSRRVAGRARPGRHGGAQRVPEVEQVRPGVLMGSDSLRRTRATIMRRTGLGRAGKFGPA